MTLQWGPFCDSPSLRPLLVPGLTVKVEEPKYKKDKQLNEKISLFRGDITKLEVDAIINAGEWGWLPGARDLGHLVTFVLVCHARHGGCHLAPVRL